MNKFMDWLKKIINEFLGYFKPQQTNLISASCEKNPKTGLKHVIVKEQPLTDTQKITKAIEEFQIAVDELIQQVSCTEQFRKNVKSISERNVAVTNSLRRTNDQNGYYKCIPGFGLNYMFRKLLNDIEKEIMRLEKTSPEIFQKPQQIRNHILQMIENFDNHMDNEYLDERGRNNRIEDIHMSRNIRLGLLSKEELELYFKTFANYTSDISLQIRTKLEDDMNDKENSFIDSIVDYYFKMRQAVRTMGKCDGLYLALIKSLNEDLVVPKEVIEWYKVSTVPEIKEKYKKYSLGELSDILSTGFEGEDQNFFTNLFNDIVIDTEALLSRGDEYVQSKIKEFRNREDIDALKDYLAEFCKYARYISLDNHSGTQIVYIKDGNPIFTNPLPTSRADVEKADAS